MQGKGYETFLHLNSLLGITFRQAPLLILCSNYSLPVNEGITVEVCTDLYYSNDSSVFNCYKGIISIVSSGKWWHLNNVMTLMWKPLAKWRYIAWGHGPLARTGWKTTHGNTDITQYAHGETTREQWVNGDHNHTTYERRGHMNALGCHEEGGHNVWMKQKEATNTDLTQYEQRVCQWSRVY